MHTIVRRTCSNEVKNECKELLTRERGGKDISPEAQSYHVISQQPFKDIKTYLYIHFLQE